MNNLGYARAKARKEGIKITDKQELTGFRVSYFPWCDMEANGIDGDGYLVELCQFDRERWEVYDFCVFPTKWAARESGKEDTRQN